MGLSTLTPPVDSPLAATDRECMEDVGFMTCMTLVLLGNYAQTGHFGGPLAYTPYNVAAHLASIPLVTASCWRAATTSPPATPSG
jgi:hypothetical protein